MFGTMRARIMSKLILFDKFETTSRHIEDLKDIGLSVSENSQIVLFQSFFIDQNIYWENCKNLGLKGS